MVVTSLRQNKINPDRNRGNAVQLEPPPVVNRGSNGFVELVSETKSDVGLPVVPVKVKARGGRDPVLTYAFLDGGSNSTLYSRPLNAVGL